jgi:CRISPR/Cas system-associated exonuclease Cas4 (RecB family)
MGHIALSYSRLSTFERCPRKFKSQYIDKDYPDEGDNFFFKKGQRKHEQLEHYILSKGNPLAGGTMRYDDDVEAMFPMIDDICNAMPKFTAEQKLAVDMDFQPCSWFDKSTMYRAIVDFQAIAPTAKTMAVIDWKTGKYREYDATPTSQLHLTSAIMFAHHPEIERIIAAYAFIEHKQMDKTPFTCDQAGDLRQPFVEAFEAVNAEEEWAPKQNEYCKYCLLTNKQCPFK